MLQLNACYFWIVTAIIYRMLKLLYCLLIQCKSFSILAFSAAKAAQGMQMSVNLSVCPSVRPSITPIFLAKKSLILKAEMTSSTSK